METVEELPNTPKKSIPVYVTDDQRKRVKKAAKAKGMSLSSFMILKALDEL